MLRDRVVTWFSASPKWVLSSCFLFYPENYSFYNFTFNIGKGYLEICFEMIDQTKETWSQVLVDAYSFLVKIWINFKNWESENGCFTPAIMSASSGITPVWQFVLTDCTTELSGFFKQEKQKVQECKSDFSVFFQELFVLRDVRRDQEELAQHLFFENQVQLLPERVVH